MRDENTRERKENRLNFPFYCLDATKRCIVTNIRKCVCVCTLECDQLNDYSQISSAIQRDIS